MFRGLMSTLALIFAVGVATAQSPSVSSVVNSASNLLPALPNSGIAQGALMTIFGANLGPGSLTVASKYPLTTALSGTSVRITVGGRSVDAFLYYTSATQVAAIVPSTTSTGAGTLAVTYNQQTSATFPITIVQSNVGLYTVNSGGSGYAVATFADYSYVTPANAANPGDIVVLWADGLGPIGSDDSLQPVSSDMTDVPVEVFIGGELAKVLFRGRNPCCSSLDQINVQIPDGVAGCITPIAVKINNLVSNTALLPLAASGRKCTTNNPAITDDAFQSLVTAAHPVTGQVAMLRSTIRQPGSGNTITTTSQDAGSAFFSRWTPAYPYAMATAIDLPPPGSCLISVTPAPSSETSALDAGPAITITGPAGTKTYPQNSSLSYLGAAGPANFFEPGSFSISGAGGKDIGSFQTTVTLPQSVIWTNQTSITSVSRAAGVRVNWSGGDPVAGLMQISGASSAALSATTSATVRFDCAAKVADGSFTIPPAVLLSLPPTTGNVLGTLTVGDTYKRVPFKATGVDYGFIYFGVSGLNLSIVPFQ